MLKYGIIAVAIVGFFTVPAPRAVVVAETSALRAGAFKVDITPAPDAALPLSGYGSRTEGFTAIHDELNVRAIVLDDGATQAVLIGCEVIGINAALWERIAGRIAIETKIPRENIMLASVHTHAAPAIGTYDEPAEGDVLRKRGEYVQRLEDAVLTAVRGAQARLQPARIGFGTGKANVNSNRRAPDGSGGLVVWNKPDGGAGKNRSRVKGERGAGGTPSLPRHHAG